MTGPEHFKVTEGLLSQATEVEPDSDVERYCLTAAKVHATLALAAATALGAFGSMPLAEYQAWADVCGELEAAAGAAGEGAKS